MINFYKNVLPLDFFNKFTNHINDNLNQSTWTSSLFWKKPLTKNSVPLIIKKIDDPELLNTIITSFIKLNKKHKRYRYEEVFFYIWPSFSYINWHDDHSWDIASSIYINEHWDINDGGLFLYKHKGENKFYCPEFNTCVVNQNHLSHATTMIVPNAPHRLSIQIFGKK